MCLQIDKIHVEKIESKRLYWKNGYRIHAVYQTIMLSFLLSVSRQSETYDLFKITNNTNICN